MKRLNKLRIVQACSHQTSNDERVDRQLTQLLEKERRKRFFFLERLWKTSLGQALKVSFQTIWKYIFSLKISTEKTRSRHRLRIYDRLTFYCEEKSMSHSPFSFPRKFLLTNKSGMAERLWGNGNARASEFRDGSSNPTWGENIRKRRLCHLVVKIR